MGFHVRSRATAVLLAVALALPLVLVPGDATAQSLEEIQRRLASVRAERVAIEQRLEQATAAFDELETRIGELEQERDGLERELSGLRRELADVDALVTFRVRETFKHGSQLDPIAVFLSSDDPSAALSRAQTIRRFVAADQARGQDLQAMRSRTEAAETRLAEHTAELEVARDEQARLGDELQTDFERLQTLEAGLTRQEREERDRLERIRIERERRDRERREREAAAVAARARSAASRPGGGGGSAAASTGGSAGGASGGTACPLDRPRSFTNSWGAPRSGGRGHRGTDIMGPHGTPVRAITSGVWVHQRQGASAGIWGILRGDNGNHYWYMHLSSHTVSSGARVSAGQQVGRNGATGNAPPNAPHVHFELHPGGGSAVNPYSLLRQVCG